MLKRLACAASLLWLAACSSLSAVPPAVAPAVRYQPASFAELPAWGDAATPAASLTALRESCRSLQNRREWQAPCAAAAAADAANPGAVRSFYESHFDAWRIEENGQPHGLITGYYEPLLAGSRERSSRTPYPVYGVPADLLLLELTPALRSQPQLVLRRGSGNRLQVVAGKQQPEAGEYLLQLADFAIDSRSRVLKGRADGQRLLPYYSRAEIAAGKGIASAPILAWVEDEVELFFLQVQGSGRILLDDGSYLRAGYAEQNGHPYKSIGRYLVDKGEMRIEQVSMQSIKAWLAANPQRHDELFAANPSYVFFKPLAVGDGGPLGALGVPLTDGYSVAVDPRYIPLGAPVYLATSWPQDGEARPLNRLMQAQDTGGAIRGAVRADFFFGFGAEAGMYAGRMKQRGRLWLLLPKGMRPQVQL